MRIEATLRRISALAGLVALLSSGSAWAVGPPAPENLVKAGLVAEGASIAAGATLWVDLHLEIKPGWHVYWQNPGDSGLPTTIDWKLPPGFSAGHILWPVPEHFVQNGIGNYGYAGTVDLLVPIAAPKELAVGQTTVLDAEASWLACADICIPGGAKLGLRLPVAAQAAPPILPLRHCSRRRAGTCRCRRRSRPASRPMPMISGFWSRRAPSANCGTRPECFFRSRNC